ncbi:Methyltransferase type 11 [Dillenia turbinata]|uniref:Methyltransferase type 11 n=1 Tax=Dillenia turbinata TaxID=194707 RepID=A0AAN8VPE1_9MAGN
MASSHVALLAPPALRSPVSRFRGGPVRCANERQALFSRIAPVYGNLNDLLCLGQHRIWKRMAVKGLDFSREQLAVAVSRQHMLSKSCYRNIEWIEGNAVDLPFSDCFFDAITVLQCLCSTLIKGWMIFNVVVPVASGYGLAQDYQYLKSSILGYLTGKELEEIALLAGFSSAKHYEIGRGLMGNLVAKR